MVMIFFHRNMERKVEETGASSTAVDVFCHMAEEFEQPYSLEFFYVKGNYVNARCY